jgi:hypothetical protein
MADDYYQSYLDNRGMSASTFSGTDNQPVKRTRKQKYRDALDAASKFKERTDYKAEKEAEEKTAAKKATMKIAPDISVMEGYQDPGFTLAGQKGTRGGILGTVGSAVGGFVGGPLGGQIGGAIGSSFG